MTRMFLSPPHMGSYEFELVREAFASNWVAPVGPHVDAFEREFAESVGVKHAAAVASGTAALHLALRILGVGQGDEVLCSTLTFVASITPALMQGAKPVFLDSEERSWNLDPGLLEDVLHRRAAVGRLPKALIAVDLYGQCADYAAIEALCERYGVVLVEDAAEALGSNANGRSAGTYGKCAAFSFNGNKIITTSGGGMLVSNDEHLIQQARFLATQARDPAAHYQHSQWGYNYRLSNVLAGIGRGQLRVLEERVNARRRIFESYRLALSSLSGLQFMPEAPWGRCTRWLTCLTIDPEASGGITRETVRLALEAANIEARPLWKPLHLQPVFQNLGCEVFGGGVSERLFAQGLCLPSGSAMSDSDINRVVDIVRSCWTTPES